MLNFSSVNVAENKSVLVLLSSVLAILSLVWAKLSSVLAKFSSVVAKISSVMVGKYIFCKSQTQSQLVVLIFIYYIS